jgi:hypothetical protein
MIANLMDILFGCWHSNYSFPITVKSGSRHGAARATGTYVVCLDCGREFAYDWKAMKVVGENFNAAAKASPVLVESREPLATKQAA